MNNDDPAQKSLRATERKLLPLGLSATLIDPNGFRAFVLIHDISQGGVCVTRQGKFRISNDVDVQIEVSDHDAAQKLTLPANVRWVHVGRFITMIGLSLDNRGGELEAFMESIHHDR